MLIETVIHSNNATETQRGIDRLNAYPKRFNAHCCGLRSLEVFTFVLQLQIADYTT